MVAQQNRVAGVLQLVLWLIVQQNYFVLQLARYYMHQFRLAANVLV